MKKILLTFVGMALSALPFSTSAFAQTKATADEAVVKAVTQAAETYPFELSTAPTDSLWKPDTKWYTLKLHNKYLTYVSGQSYIPLLSTVDTKNKNALWAFVEENGKIKIYNAGAGAEMILAAPSNVQFTGSTYATMTSTNSLTEKTGTWEFSAGQNGAFFLKLDGVQNAYMNDFAENGKVAFWNAADGGSTFSVSPVESLPVLDVQYSTAPTESGFAPDTKWHTLTIRDYFICYDVDHDYMNLNTKQNPNNYGSYWAFVKKQTENGTEVVEIYNAGAGPNKVLSSVVPPSGQDKTTFPHMADKNAANSSLTQSWDLKKNNTPHVLFLKLHGTASAYLNYRDAKLAYWDNSSALGDNGSTVRAVQFTDADIQAQNTKAKDCFTQAPIGCVGGLATDTEKQKVLTELNKSTLLGYAAGMSAVAQSCVKLDTNKCYRLKSSHYSKYMTMAMNGNSVSAKGQDLNNADVAQVWNFTPDGNGFKVGAQHRFLKAVTQSTQVPTTDETDPTTGAAKYHLMTMSPTKFAIDADGGNASTKDKLHEDASHNIVGWGSDADASQWYLMPATTIEVSVSAAGYTTVNYPFAVQLPETGLQAFIGNTAKSKGQDVFVLRELRDKMIPANTPMILAGTQGTYTLTILDKNTEVPSIDNNPLEGTYMQRTMSNGVVTYVLSKPSSFEVGFYKLEDTEDMQNGATPNRLIPSNKAYLPGSSLSQTTAQTYGFAFSLDENGGGTTGIEEETVTDLSKEEFFDLQGRRVMKPSKGIFVTKSGKKVLFF